MLNDEDFLKIKSPKISNSNKGGGVLGGPYVVVHASEENGAEWAIVALDWCNNASKIPPERLPRFGVRWGCQKGFPLAGEDYPVPVWMILPIKVTDAILKNGAFGLPQEKINWLKKFVAGGDGKELKRKWDEYQEREKINMWKVYSDIVLNTIKNIEDRTSIIENKNLREFILATLEDSEMCGMADAIFDKMLDRRDRRLMFGDYASDDYWSSDSAILSAKKEVDTYDKNLFERINKIEHALIDVEQKKLIDEGIAHCYNKSYYIYKSQ